MPLPSLIREGKPLRSVPIKLPWTALAPAKDIEIPLPRLPETRFRASGVEPPTVVAATLFRVTPSPPFGRAMVPETSVPMKSPTIWSAPSELSSMPLPPNPLIAMP